MSNIQKKIPTPEEFFNKRADELESDRNDMPQWMIDEAGEYAKKIVKYTLEQAAENGKVRCFSVEGKDEQKSDYFYFVDADETVKIDPESILSLEDQIIKDLKL